MVKTTNISHLILRRCEMKHLVGALVLIIFLALVSNADAQTNIGTSIFSWNPPTQYEDNSPLPASQIGGYLIQLRPEGNGPYTELRADAKATEIPLTLPFGNYEVRVLCWDVNGIRSMYSSVKKFTIKTAPKKPLYPAIRVVQ